MITAMRGEQINSSEIMNITGINSWGNINTGGKVVVNIYGLPGVASIEEYTVIISINSHSYIYRMRDLVLSTKDGTIVQQQVGQNTLYISATESAVQNSFGDSDIDVQCYTIYVGYTGNGKVDVAVISNMRLLGEVGPASFPITVSYTASSNSLTISNIPSNIVLTFQNLFYLIAYVEVIVAVLMLLYLLYIKRTSVALIYFLTDYIILGLVSLNNDYATVVTTLAVGYIEYRQYKEIRMGTYRYGMGIVNR